MKWSLSIWYSQKKTLTTSFNKLSLTFAFPCQFDGYDYHIWTEDLNGKLLSKEIRWRVRLLRKQSLTWYYVYEVMSSPSRGVNVVAVDATNTLFWYQQDAAVAIQKLFHDLNDTNDGKGSVNVLVATQALESFAFDYAKTHLKKNESIIVVEENYGMSICSVAISPCGCVKSVSEVFRPVSY